MTCTVEVITTIERLREIAPIWEDLVARAGMTDPFVTPTWIETWWESFGAGAELMVLLVRADGQPVAIAPLQIGTERIYGARHRCVRFLANQHSPRCDFVVAANHEEAYAAICRFLMTESADWDVLRLCDVPAASGTLRELAQYAARYGFLSGLRHGPESPFLPTTSQWDAYFETLPAKRRWFLRNRLKRLSKRGRVLLETIPGGDDLESALEDGYRLEAAAWKGKAGTAIACSAGVRRFYTTLAKRCAERGWLRLHFLKVGDRRIAFAYCVAYANRMFLLKPGFDPEFAAFSPGHLLFYLALQQMHLSGFVAYDFLGYGDAWKRQWADQTTEHGTLFVYANQPLTRLDHYTKFALMPRLRRARNFILHARH